VSIIVKLDDMLHERRVTLTELSERIGITLANLSVLKTGKARAIRFSTLDAICAALQCQPGDLLEFAPASLADVDKAAAALDHETDRFLNHEKTLQPAERHSLLRRSNRR
jgi:putative transcriptional regulator